MALSSEGYARIGSTNGFSQGAGKGDDEGKPYGLEIDNWDKADAVE